MSSVSLTPVNKDYLELYYTTKRFNLDVNNYYNFVVQQLNLISNVVES